MKLSYILAALDELAPRAIQENWDNSGLQVGLPEGQEECTGALICLDVTEAIIREAVSKGCNLVVSHHPLIFKGLKSLTGSTPAERAVALALRSGVAVYSAHTSLDSAPGGINAAIAKAIGLTDCRVLAPSAMPMVKVSVTCARADADDVRLLLLDNAVETAVDWNTEAYALEADKATENAAAPVFSIGHTPLTRVETVVPQLSLPVITEALANYDGCAPLRVETVELSNGNAGYGLGIVGNLPAPVEADEFGRRLREIFRTPAIRTTARGIDAGFTLWRVALCGGSGGEFIGAARRAGAQAYISGDIRYHDLCDNTDTLAIYDIGHFESEICAKNIFFDFLSNKFRNFAVYKSDREQNPVKYII